MKLAYIAISIVLVCAAALLLVTGLTKPSAAIQEQHRETGTVVLVGLDGGSYTFTPSTVPTGEPVTLRNDGTVQGCAMFMVQPELGIEADFSASRDYTFTPRKTGTFTVACSMNMYRGTLEVV